MGQADGKGDDGLNVLILEFGFGFSFAGECAFGGRVFCDAAHAVLRELGISEAFSADIHISRQGGRIYLGAGESALHL